MGLCQFRIPHQDGGGLGPGGCAPGGQEVLLHALENAASISAMLLTTEALVGDRLAPPSATGAGMPAGDMSGAMY